MRRRREPLGHDGARTRFPVSVKGVLVRDGRVVLMKNPRDEWELPGGKLEDDESPETCLAREIREELGVDIRVGRLVDAWVYPVRPDASVLIVAYACELDVWPARLESPEGHEVGLFLVDALAGLPLPEGYRLTIRRAVGAP